MRSVLQIVLVIVLIFINAFFSLAEYALMGVRSTRIRQLVEEGNRSARLVEEMKEHLTRMQATIQMGLTLVATLSSALAATSLITPVTNWIVAHTAGVMHSYASTLALLTVTLPVAILTLVIGEITPKTLALHHSERLALLAVHPIRWLQILLTPAVAFLEFLSNLLTRPFGVKAGFTPVAADAEEYKMIVEAGKESGVLDQQETSMIHQALDFSDTIVRKVMTPRIDLTAEDVAVPMMELIRDIAESGHSRIPIYEGGLDNIIGIVHAKDLLNLKVDADPDTVSIREVMRSPYFIPETKRLGDLLAEFRRSKQQLAIVRDEYGITSGLVTIEDLLEQIVGDIQDEYDVEEPMVQVIDSHTTIFDGLMGLNEVNDRMGLELPEDQADTIGGFVFSLLGHQAQQGEHATYENIHFVVEATDGRRITKVRLVHNAPPTDLYPDSHNERAAVHTIDELEQQRNPLEDSDVEAAPPPSMRS